jgi:hypothetical protein
MNRVPARRTSSTEKRMPALHHQARGSFTHLAGEVAHNEAPLRGVGPRRLRPVDWGRHGEHEKTSSNSTVERLSRLDLRIVNVPVVDASFERFAGFGNVRGIPDS